MLKLSYAEKLIQIRTRHNLSQEELALRLGLTYATVNRLENGHHEPQATTRGKIDALFSALEERVPAEKYPHLSVIMAHSKRSKLTILLDENLFQLKPALRDSGFKVLVLKKGLPDEEVRELAEGTAILTNNSKDFLPYAVADDYDVISVEGIKFVDTDPTRKNQTARKITKAIQESGLTFIRGNFNLIIKNNGAYEIKPLV